MATIQEIADLAGVSRGTVDRVVNQRGKVKADVEAKILQVMDECGYEHKQRRRTYTIGVVTQLFDASFMKDIQAGLDEAVEEYKERGITLHMLHSSDVDENQQLSLIEQLEKEGIDALAIMPVDHKCIAQKINELVDRGIPVVTFNSDIAGTKRLCYIGMDNHRSGKAAAGLMSLLTRAQGDILIITGYFTNRANSMRVEAFVEELQKQSKMQLLGVQCSYDKADIVEDIVTRTLHEHPDIKGIFLASAGHAGIHKALAQCAPQQRPYIIAYDVTKETSEYLNQDTFDFLIDQENHIQGYQAIRVIYELLVKKQSPAKEELFTDIQLKTRYTI